MTRSRVLVRRVHLWLGLSLGALFVLLGLTGSALVFYVAIDEALQPVARSEAQAPAPDWRSPVWDRALATGRAAYPDPKGNWSIEVTGQGGAIPARFYTAKGGHGHHAERQMLWFSPDGTRIVRDDPWGGYMMSWLYELHMHLLAGDTGRQVVGWSGAIMLVLLATGIAAWWPRGSWTKALAFKRRAVPIRRLRDLHKLSGLWSALLLLILVATGVLLALPDVKAWMIAPTPVPAPRSATASGRQVSITRALSAALPALPDARLAFIDVPGAGDGVFRMRMQVPGDPHRRFPGSFVFVDQYSARVLAVHDVRTGRGGDLVSRWVRPLHDGSAGGLVGRIIAVIAGLVPAVLFVTGLLHWRRRGTACAAAPTIVFQGE